MFIGFGFAGVAGVVGIGRGRLTDAISFAQVVVTKARLISMSDQTRKIVEEILRRKLSETQIGKCLSAPNTWVGDWGRCPADLIATEPDRVIAAAQHEVARAGAMTAPPIDTDYPEASGCSIAKRSCSGDSPFANKEQHC
jgi:hypothetical protein